MIDRVTRTRGLPSLAMLVVLAAFSSGCSATATVSATPPGATTAFSAPPMASVEPTTPVARPTETPSAVATPEPTASASASSAALADGDYVSGIVTHATAETLLKDPKIASDAGVKSFLAEFTTTLVSTLRLKNPSWVQLVHEDGQDKGIGDGGTYAFVNDHTIAIQGYSGKCNGTFGFSMHGESLKFTVLTDSCGPAAEALDRVIYQSSVWTRTP